MLPWRFGAREAMAAASSPTLAKWIQPMRGLGPTGIPVLSGTPDPVFANTTLYNVTAGEFTDQLHPALGPTKLWGYWDSTNPVKRHLGGVVVATRGNAARLRFTNTLPTRSLIPIDTTLPGANQAQNRIAIHLHGGYVPWTSDGGPFDWWTPTGASGLSFLNGPGGVTDNITGMPMTLGQADYFYPNDQSTRLMWYHDHAHGITRTNAYAGLATGYLVLDPAQEALIAGKVPSLSRTLPLIFQDKVFVDPATTPLTDPTWSLVARPDVQSLGSLWYEHVYNPKEFKLKKGGAFVAPPDPSCIPEFFGDTMLCNGTVYPVLDVEPTAYRLLYLNACNARFLNINVLEVAPGAEIMTDPKTGLPVAPVLGPPMIQIGTEGGYLVNQVTHPNGLFFNPATLTGNLLIGNAERADVIIDFTNMAGKEYILYNDAPGPFPAGPPTTDFWLGNPKNPIQPLPGTGPDTRQILRIRVNKPLVLPAEPIPAPGILTGVAMDPPALIQYPTTTAPIPPLVAPITTPVRDLTLNEDFDPWGRLRQLLGTTTINPVLGAFGREYLEPATEVIAAGSTEVWRIFNLTADTHPIHFHIVNVQVMSRQPFRVINGVFTPTGVARGPEPNELGWKETVQMHPGEVISVIMKFDLPMTPFVVPPSKRPMGDPLVYPGGVIPQANEYVWHCHILEHEEHDMMRPLVVTGTNPVGPMIAVTPATQTVVGATGGTVAYNVTNSVGYTVTSSDPVNYPAVLAGLGFQVTVPALAALATVTFTVSDNTGRAAATATLVIA